MDMTGRAGSKCSGPALSCRVKLLCLLDFIREMCYSTTVILTIRWTFLTAARRTNNYAHPLSRLSLSSWRALSFAVDRRYIRVVSMLL